MWFNFGKKKQAEYKSLSEMVLSQKATIESLTCAIKDHYEFLLSRVNELDADISKINSLFVKTGIYRPLRARTGNEPLLGTETSLQYFDAVLCNNNMNALEDRINRLESGLRKINRKPRKTRKRRAKHGRGK